MTDLEGTSSGHGLICIQRRAGFLPKELADSFFDGRHSRGTAHYFYSMDVIFFQICTGRGDTQMGERIISSMHTIQERVITYELVPINCARELPLGLKYRHTSPQTEPCHGNKTSEKLSVNYWSGLWSKFFNCARQEVMYNRLWTQRKSFNLLQTLKSHLHAIGFWLKE